MWTTYVFVLGLVCLSTVMSMSDPDCRCPPVLTPVCTDFGITFQNECMANCYGATVLFEGFCEERDRRRDECPCTFDWNPVCTENGITYVNVCFAECSGATVLYEGFCEEQYRRRDT